MVSSGIQTSGGVRTGITALAGAGTPALAANTLDYGVNVVSVVASSGDGVILPAGVPQGGRVKVFNTAATNTTDVFPNTGGTINAGTATTGQVGVATLTGATFIQVGTDGLTWVVDNAVAAIS